MEQVLAYIDSQEPSLQPLFLALHDKLMAHPNMEAKIRYRIPFYFGQSWICYVNPLKTGGLELAFVRGNELETVKDLLEFRDRKQVGGVMLRVLTDLEKPELSLILQEAVLLDRHIPYASKRKPKGKGTEI